MLVFTLLTSIAGAGLPEPTVPGDGLIVCDSHASMRRIGWLLDAPPIVAEQLHATAAIEEVDADAPVWFVFTGSQDQPLPRALGLTMAAEIAAPPELVALADRAAVRQKGRHVILTWPAADALTDARPLLRLLDTQDGCAMAWSGGGGTFGVSVSKDRRRVRALERLQPEDPRAGVDMVPMPSTVSTGTVFPTRSRWNRADNAEQVGRLLVGFGLPEVELVEADLRPGLEFASTGSRREAMVIPTRTRKAAKDLVGSLVAAARSANTAVDGKKGNYALATETGTVRVTASGDTVLVARSPTTLAELADPGRGTPWFPPDAPVDGGAGGVVMLSSEPDRPSAMRMSNSDGFLILTLHGDDMLKTLRPETAPPLPPEASCEETTLPATLVKEGVWDEKPPGSAQSIQLDTLPGGGKSWGVHPCRPEKGLLALAEETVVVLPDTEVRLVIDYPLSKPAVFTLRDPDGFTRAELAAAAASLYQRIYRAEAASQSAPTPAVKERRGLINRPSSDGIYGIWGHDLEDLIIHTVIVHRPDAGSPVLLLGVDS